MVSAIALSGYYGFGNAGDEAVLAGLLRSLREQASGPLSIEVLSIDPVETARTHGAPASHRYRLGPVLRSIARSDLLLSGGGSLLQDVTSGHSLFYYLAIVRAAQLLGKRTMFIAQGIGPLNRKRSRRLVASVANRLSAITVRDEASAALLGEIGVRGVPLEITADPALLLDAGIAANPREHDRIGLSLRPWPGFERLPEHVAEALHASVPRERMALLPMQPASDGPALEQFSKAWPGDRVVRPDLSSLDHLLREVARCGIVIGMRLHALILAAACGTPAVAISYDPKVTAFMAQAGQADAVCSLPPQGRDGFESLCSAVAMVRAERGARESALAMRLPALRIAAGRNAEVALGLIHSRS